VGTSICCFIESVGVFKKVSKKCQKIFLETLGITVFFEKAVGNIYNKPCPGMIHLENQGCKYNTIIKI